MAVDLGINLHTVNRAYDLLRTEGFIRMSGRKGAWIAPAPPRYDGAFLEELGWQMRNLYREALSRGVERGVFESLLQRIIAEEPGAVSN
jgi:DNA-binding transcriptional regulator YhcF (GntR family)